MDANTMIARIEQLQNAVEQSAANHNSLVGRLMEAKDTLHQLTLNQDNVVDFSGVTQDVSFEDSSQMTEPLEVIAEQ